MKDVELSVAILIGLVIAGAFFAGLSIDGQTVFAGLVKLVNVLQGRKSDGNFPDYPGNAPANVNTVMTR